VLRISAAARLPVAKLGKSSALRVGEWVIALGSPLHLSNRCGAARTHSKVHRAVSAIVRAVLDAKSSCSVWTTSSDWLLGRTSCKRPVWAPACSVSAGIVSALERKGAELGLDSASTDYIQTDAATAAGSSGGPLVNVQVCDGHRFC
jgi:S1-C subfamily serine protease